MKKIGIVGGIAWPSTADYYSGICRRSEQWHLARNPQSVPSTPEMTIESLDVNKAVSLLGIDDETSGADFALIASNTPHHRFASIVRGIEIPVLSTLDVVAKESARIGASEVLILGTAVTMRSAKFREGFAKYGVEASGPRDEAATAMTAGLIAELQLGKLEGTAARLAKIVRISFKEPFRTRRVVCLACTELPLAFQEQKTRATFEHDGILYLNSTALHIDAAFDFAVDHSMKATE